MRIKRWMSLLKSCLEAAWISVRFCLMLRKMGGQRTERAKNRQEMLWGILCSTMCVQGIFTYIKGYVEMMEGNAGGIKKMLEGAGAATVAATMKQYGEVLVGTEVKENRETERF